MKYNAGDCLSFKVSPGTYCAGFISAVQGGKYHIAPCNFKADVSPPVRYFRDCMLFSLNYVLPDQTISTLDVMVLEPSFADASEDIKRITQIEIPGFLSSSGFHVVNSMQQLHQHFEQGLKLRSQEDPGSFEVRAFVSIQDCLNAAPKRNEFPVLKLYRQENKDILYWQIYGSSVEPVGIVMHYGILGQKGEFVEVKDRPIEELRELYAQSISDKKAEGYNEPEGVHQLILQFPVDEGWGNTDDLGFRNEMWDHLDQYLFWTGNGRISGGDIGSGTVNLFFEAISAQIAIETIIDALKEKQVDKQFIIALENTDGEATVLYPEDHNGVFFY